jgi:polyhydroxybutyrate depolymerase
VRSALSIAAVIAAGCGSSPGSGVIDATPSTDDAAPFVDAGPCGMRSGMRALSQRHVQIGSLDRTYLVYLPPDVDPATPVPLVLVHHGYTMSGQIMYDITGYPALADREHVALAFPDGQGGPNSSGAPWNVGKPVCTTTAGPPPVATGDDFALIDAMKADIAQDQCIDPAHVYLTGFSMGGYFSHHAGCNRADLRAVAPHSGGTHTLDGCPVGHKPIIIFHGKSDPLVPDGCDDPAGVPVTGFTPSAKAWAEHNGCATTTHSIPVTNGTCLVYDGCPADGQVELCTFTGMGHCWAGGTAGNIYSCANYASATELEWEFFKQHAW